MTSVDIQTANTVYGKNERNKQYRQHKKFSQTAGFDHRINHSVNLGPNDNKNFYPGRTCTTTMPFFSQESDIQYEKTKKMYISSNKKKLFNFYEERIPRQRLKVFRNQQQFSPIKIFKMRKDQNEKQKSTWMSLKQSFEVSKYPIKPLIPKIQAIFVENSIKPAKKSFSVNPELNKNHSQSSYRQATQSSYMKRAKTAKNQAYNRVFGDNIKIKENKIKVQSVIAQNSKIFISSKSRQLSREKDRVQFTNLLKKLNNYSQQFSLNKQEDKLQEKQGRQKLLTEEQTNTDNMGHLNKHDKIEMLDLIKHISFDYKQKTIKVSNMNVGDELMNKIYQKQTSNVISLSSQFYNDLKQHKRSRLKVRQLALKDCVQLKPHFNNSRQIATNDLKDEYDVQFSNNENLTMILTITDRALQSINTGRQTVQVNRRVFQSYKQKFCNFSNNLIKSMHLMKFYQLPKDRLYDVLWRIRTPFQLEGSYTLFKYIKMGDLKTVQKFHAKNKNYILEIDNERRTALIYAIQNQQNQIVKFLVQNGVSIDFKTNNKKNALYYALRSNDEEIVGMLLRTGTSPWSTKDCNLSDCIIRAGNSVKIIVKNARKVHIAMDLMRKFDDKLKFWNEHKNKINGQKIMSFL